MRRAAFATAFATTLAVVACSGRVLAHGDGGGGSHAVIGPVAFLVGVVVAAAAIALDARDAVGRGRADLGVFVGGGLALAGLIGYFVV